jgi:hypothetical protein
MTSGIQAYYDDLDDKTRKRDQTRLESHAKQLNVPVEMYKGLEEIYNSLKSKVNDFALTANQRLDINADLGKMKKLINIDEK